MLGRHLFQYHWEYCLHLLFGRDVPDWHWGHLIKHLSLLWDWYLEFSHRGECLFILFSWGVSHWYWEHHQLYFVWDWYLDFSHSCQCLFILFSWDISHRHWEYQCLSLLWGWYLEFSHRGECLFIVWCWILQQRPRGNHVWHVSIMCCGDVQLSSHSIFHQHVCAVSSESVL